MLWQQQAFRRLNQVNNKQACKQMNKANLTGTAPNALPDKSGADKEPAANSTEIGEAVAQTVNASSKTDSLTESGAGKTADAKTEASSKVRPIVSLKGALKALIRCILHLSWFDQKLRQWAKVSVDERKLNSRDENSICQLCRKKARGRHLRASSPRRRKASLATYSGLRPQGCGLKRLAN